MLKYKIMSHVFVWILEMKIINCVKFGLHKNEKKGIFYSVIS